MLSFGICSSVCEKNILSAVFSSQADGNGVTYFNLKAGWYLKASYSTALTTNRLLIFTVFGETYE